MQKSCEKCGYGFDARADYQRLCLRCWKEKHDEEIFEQGRQAGHATGYSRGYADGQAFERGTHRCPVASNTSYGLTKEFALQIVSLTHPDKHPKERFQKANDVTSRLLSLVS